jgi:hypothetical protein
MLSSELFEVIYRLAYEEHLDEFRNKASQALADQKEEWLKVN